MGLFPGGASRKGFNRDLFGTYHQDSTSQLRKVLARVVLISFHESWCNRGLPLCTRLAPSSSIQSLQWARLWLALCTLGFRGTTELTLVALGVWAAVVSMSAAWRHCKGGNLLFSKFLGTRDTIHNHFVVLNPILLQFPVIQICNGNSSKSSSTKSKDLWTML